MGRSFKLVTIAGIRIMIHPSWFVILGLMVASLSSFGDAGTRELSVGQRWIVAVVVALLFFVSVLAHELAHAMVGRRRGLSVNTITLFIFGGAAALEEDSPTAMTEGVVAAAGPITSAVLGLVFLGTALVFDTIPGVWADVVFWASYWLGLSNLLLCGFNLIPGFPMDGGRILRAILWGATHDYMRATRLASIIGRIIGQLIVLVGLFIALDGTVDSIVSGIWLVLIGWFLSRAASYSYKQAALERLVEGVLVRDVMDPNVPVINPNLTLDVLADQHLMTGQTDFYAVVVDGQLVGTIDLSLIRRVPRNRWTTTRVGEVMRRGDSVVTLTEPQPIMDAVSRFEQSSAQALPVVDAADGKRLLGMITRDGLLRALRTRAGALASSPT